MVVAGVSSAAKVGKLPPNGKLAGLRRVWPVGLDAQKLLAAEKKQLVEAYGSRDGVG
jgi:hypothetical protein